MPYEILHPITTTELVLWEEMCAKCLQAFFLNILLELVILPTNIGRVGKVLLVQKLSHEFSA